LKKKLVLSSLNDSKLITRRFCLATVE